MIKIRDIGGDSFHIKCRKMLKDTVPLPCFHRVHRSLLRGEARREVTWMSNEKRAPGCWLGFFGDEVLPSCVGIIS